jgi:hypothetical protein
VAGCITLAIFRVCRDRPEAQQHAMEMPMPPRGQIGNHPNEQPPAEPFIEISYKAHLNIDGSPNSPGNQMFTLS